MGLATLGYAKRPAEEFGPRPEVPDPSPIPLPSRTQGLHVVQVRKQLQSLRDASRAHGSNPQMSSAAVDWATGLLELPGTDPLKQALRVAVAELNIQAGYAAFDAGLYDRAMHHYIQGLELAVDVGDAHCQAVALMFAGVATVEHGRPNDGLAMLQIGHAIAEGIPADDERPRVVWPGSRAALQACGLADSATALARMGDPKGAAVKMARARGLWQPTAADPVGDLDQVAARLELDARPSSDARELARAARHLTTTRV
jgi:hypothetical protein